MIGLADAVAPQDDTAGREIRPRHDANELVDADLRVLDIGDAGVDHFREVVRRDVGRHADGDTAGTVDQQIGKARRQHHRLRLAVVIVRLEVDRFLVDVFQQRLGRLGKAGFGVSHRGGRIAVHRAEIALAVDQEDAEREVLRHADHGVVDRLVAVRVVLRHHLADRAGRFLEGTGGGEPALAHGVEDAAVDWFQAVADIGERAADDDAHRVVEVGAFHLLFDGDGRDAESGCCGGLSHLNLCLVIQRLTDRRGIASNRVRKIAERSPFNNKSEAFQGLHNLLTNNTKQRPAGFWRTRRAEGQGCLGDLGPELAIPGRIAG